MKDARATNLGFSFCFPVHIPFAHDFVKGNVERLFFLQVLDMHDLCCTLGDKHLVALVPADDVAGASLESPVYRRSMTTRAYTCMLFVFWVRYPSRQFRENARVSSGGAKKSDRPLPRSGVPGHAGLIGENALVLMRVESVARPRRIKNNAETTVFLILLFGSRRVMYMSQAGKRGIIPMGHTARRSTEGGYRQTA